MKRPSLQTALPETLPPGSPERKALQDHLRPRLSHGGPASRGKRKTKRPFVEKAPIRLILSSRRARGVWSLQHRRNHSRILRMIYTYGERYKLRVFRSTISANEIHLLLKASSRKGLADFLRVLAGRVAVSVSGARKGVKKIGRFWNELCWSRLLNWGSEFSQARSWFTRGLLPGHENANLEDLPVGKGLESGFS